MNPQNPQDPLDQPEELDAPRELDSGEDSPLEPDPPEPQSLPESEQPAPDQVPTDLGAEEMGDDLDGPAEEAPAVVDEPPAIEEPAPAAPAAAPVATSGGILGAIAAVFAPRWVGLFARLVVVLVLLVPFVDFMRVAASRMAYPYEVEWLEGELAVYAVRWQQTPSLAHLYPPYDEGKYVPHLYPPLHQIATAVVQQVAGGHVMGVGRFLSILSTLAIMAGIMMIVRDAGRSWLAGIAAGLLYTAYFKPSGYWYDLMRVDSMAYALAIWSAWFISRTRGGWVSMTVGLALALLAHFTKQTAVFIPFLALATRFFFSLVQLVAEQIPSRCARLRPGSRQLYASPRAPFFLIVPALFLFVNLGYFISRGALGEIGFYLYQVGGKHHIFYDKISKSGFQELWQFYTFLVMLLPLGLWAVLLPRRWGAWYHAVFALAVAVAVMAGCHHYLEALAARSGAILKAGIPGFASITAVEYTASTWTPVIRGSVAATAGGLALWATRWLLYRTTLNGLWWFGVLFASQHVAAVTWVKIGGYINNFMPLFIVQSIIFGLVVCWYFRGLERALGRFGSLIAAATVVALFSFAWVGTRDALLARHPSLPYVRDELFRFGPEVLADAPWWLTDGLRYHKGRVTCTPDAGQAAAHGWLDPEDNQRWILQDAQHLGRQVPSPLSEEWGPKVLARIAELHREGGVYLPHQNYLGHLAGVPIQPSIDSIRDVAYMGKPTPKPLLDKLRKREIKYVITMMHLKWEWVTPDFKQVMEENYELQGDLMPKMPGAALMPMTGVQMKAMHVYRAKAQQPPENKPAKK